MKFLYLAVGGSRRSSCPQFSLASCVLLCVYFVHPEHSGLQACCGGVWCAEVRPHPAAAAVKCLIYCSTYILPLLAFLSADCSCTTALLCQCLPLSQWGNVSVCCSVSLCWCWWLVSVRVFMSMRSQQQKLHSDHTGDSTLWNCLNWTRSPSWSTDSVWVRCS